MMVRHSNSAGTTVEGALTEAERALRTAGVDRPRLDARLMLAAASDLGLEQQIGAPRRELSEEAMSRFRDMVTRRVDRAPLAHILGHREFWSLDLIVTSDTLVPRPDSETVVEAALTLLDDRYRAWRVLDLGTGSGCLLLAILSELPNARGLGVDISPAALSVARVNARRLGLAARAAFAVGDWAAPFGETFDLVVANPPYIRAGDIDALAPEIARHEPRVALSGGNDGLDAYRLIAEGLNQHIGSAGMGVFEVAAGAAEAVEQILLRAGFSPRARYRDLGGVERAVAYVGGGAR
jgi:release factor glutamine methyltransferase